MPSRTRTRNEGVITGFTLKNGVVVNTTTDYSHVQRCVDVVGEMYLGGVLQDHLFDLTSTRESGNRINAERNFSGDTLTYVNRSNSWPGFLSEVRVSSSLRGDFFVRALASTGPLTPKVNLPLAVFELKDLPAMLKHAGDLLHKLKSPSGLKPAKEAAAANLAYQFGWAPLLEDLEKLMNFTSLVRKRQIELSKANSSRGLLRRMTFPDVPEPLYQHNANVLIASVAGNIYGSVTKTSSTRAWMTVRWKVKDGQNYGRIASHEEAFRSALGLNLGMIPISIWKALPWSWMIDWFADISNVLQANYNMIYYRASSVNFMEQRTLTVKVSGGMNPLGTLSAGTRTRLIKLRTPLGTNTRVETMRVPFLDTFKLSILSSLAIQRLYSRG